MVFKSNFDEISKTFMITATKRLDETIFNEFKQCYENPNLIIQPKIYQLDLRLTEEINSTGLLLLLSLFNFARDRGAKVVLVNSKPQVKQFLIENQYNEIMELG
jgi:anti-anti-sigma regulatory factor